MTRVSNSQLREPGFKSYAAASNLGQVILHFSSSLSCMNEYLAIDSGGYLCSNALITCMARCFPEKPRWYSIEQVCQGVKRKAF